MALEKTAHEHSLIGNKKPNQSGRHNLRKEKPIARQKNRARKFRIHLENEGDF